ncbi:hypothetical protein ACIQU5_29085 [Streptomyces sp. NPDC090306]|uniref:hypothetical protein n=1 Tax=unclassified Streptomyces TaxID=2593676 RepID=UPI0036E9E6F5
MRPIYVCVGCASAYLPHTNEDAGPVSPAHCGKPACAEALRQAVAMSGLAEERIGELTRRANGLEGDPLRPRLDRRRARGRRSAAAPGGGRDKLR